MAQVTLRHLAKDYGNGVQAVQDLDLEVDDGELLVLVGPSGCGKSTTLRMIAGLEAPSSGEIFIGDRLMNGVPPHRRGVAMMFQESSLYPHLTARQNIEFGLSTNRLTAAEVRRRVDETAEILGIRPLLHRRPAELSGGERQRVSLGRTLARDADIYLFDEPLSNIDAQLRLELRGEIARIHHRLKKTMIYVTHDQGEALSLGDRIVVMDRGRLQQIASPQEVYQRPANRFVASFIGSPPMNLFAGEIRAGVFHFAAKGAPIAAAPRDGSSDGDCAGQPSPLNLSRTATDNAPADGPMVLGIRPEEFSTRDGELRFARVKLDFVEWMGHDVIGHFRLAGGGHSIRLPAGAAHAAGEHVDLLTTRQACHLFNAAGDRVD